MPNKGMRPRIGYPLTRPQHERLDLSNAEHIEFWRLVLRSDTDWVSMRIWSQILFYNSYEGTS